MTDHYRERGLTKPTRKQLRKILTALLNRDASNIATVAAELSVEAHLLLVRVDAEGYVRAAELVELLRKAGLDTTEKELIGVAEKAKDGDFDVSEDGASVRHRDLALEQLPNGVDVAASAEGVRISWRFAHVGWGLFAAVLTVVMFSRFALSELVRGAWLLALIYYPLIAALSSRQHLGVAKGVLFATMRPFPLWRGVVLGAEDVHYLVVEKIKRGYSVFVHVRGAAPVRLVVCWEREKAQFIRDVIERALGADVTRMKRELERGHKS